MSTVDCVEKILDTYEIQDKKYYEFCDALKNFNEMVENGIITPRGNRLLQGEVVEIQWKQSNICKF